MKLLALDTATEACSAALLVDGDIRHRYQLAPREHSRLILGMLDSLLAEAGLVPGDLDALAFGRGPGAFMGLRIAAGVTQGMAMARDLPVIPVSDLLAMAAVAHRQTGCEQALCAIDARMGEVYWAACDYRRGQWQYRVDECVAAADKVVFPEDGHWTGVGTGWETYRTVLQERAARLGIVEVLPRLFPDARAILDIAVDRYRSGKVLDAAQAQPVYLRNDVAKKPQPKTFSRHLNLE